jgi:hypothetical protein
MTSKLWKLLVCLDTGIGRRDTDCADAFVALAFFVPLTFGDIPSHFPRIRYRDGKHTYALLPPPLPQPHHAVALLQAGMQSVIPSRLS